MFSYIAGEFRKILLHFFLQMKIIKLHIVLFLFFSPALLRAQNLVFNPSFEKFSNYFRNLAYCILYYILYLRNIIVKIINGINK